VRVFFAIPLPEALKIALGALQARLRQSGVAASWPDPQGLHLTLAFLGEQPVESVPTLLAVAKEALAGQVAFPLATDRLGGFPKDRAARVLWLGLGAQPALGRLAAALRLGLVEAAIPFDEKPFKAHLTLARFREAQDMGRFEPPREVLRFLVREVLLFQSVQTPAGSCYHALRRIPLRP
jgi:RNA 2',3'-cyclic 3'-phosphodiesterase